MTGAPATWPPTQPAPFASKTVLARVCDGQPVGRVSTGFAETFLASGKARLIGNLRATRLLVGQKAPGVKMSDRHEQSAVMTLKEAAVYLRVSKAHLSNVINGRVRGVPPLRHAPIGRRILIRREWADEWLELAGH
jgi:excisionase family DNA binding protein